MLLSKYKKKIPYLFSNLKKKAGRSNTGRITVAHQGGGHKQMLRIINFTEYSKLKGNVIGIEYDPVRTSYIAKIMYILNNIKYYYYIICPQKLKILDSFNDFENNISDEIKYKQLGNFYPLKDYAVGDYIYNIELFSKKGGKLVRSAGTFAKILVKQDNFVTIQLPSGEHRKIKDDCLACFGVVSNEKHMHSIIGKAGKSRWLNRRPTVRGVAKNPVDHPHGGNTSGGRYHKTPWARLTKGVPTRIKKKINKLIIKKAKIK